MDKTSTDARPCVSVQTITLKFPVTADGTELRSLRMRRPKVRDQVYAEKGGGTDAEREIRLFASLCEVAPETIEELTLSDYKQLQEAFSGFLSAD
jgi:hypothetical protein